MIMRCITVTRAVGSEWSIGGTAVEVGEEGEHYFGVVVVVGGDGDGRHFDFLVLIAVVVFIGMEWSGGNDVH